MSATNDQRDAVRTAAIGLARAIGIPDDTIFVPISRQLYDRTRAELGDGWSNTLQVSVPELYNDCLVDPIFRYFSS